MHAHDDSIVLPHWEIRLSDPTQSHYPDIKLTSPCLILIVLTKQGHDNYQICKLPEIELPTSHIELGSVRSTDLAAHTRYIINVTLWRAGVGVNSLFI